MKIVVGKPEEENTIKASVVATDAKEDDGDVDALDDVDF